KQGPGLFPQDPTVCRPPPAPAPRTRHDAGPGTTGTRRGKVHDDPPMSNHPARHSHAADGRHPPHALASSPPAPTAHQTPTATAPGRRTPRPDPKGRADRGPAAKRRPAREGTTSRGGRVSSLERR